MEPQQPCTGSKDLNLTGISLTQQFNHLSLDVPRPDEQPEESSENSDDEEEEEEDEDEDEVNEPEEEEEEDFGICAVCLKDAKHSKFDCPYLNRIPNPYQVTVGSGYSLVCKRCHLLGGHPGSRWVGRALVKSCGICNERASHWSCECPKNPNPRKFDLFNNPSRLQMKVNGPCYV